MARPGCHYDKQKRKIVNGAGTDKPL